MLLFHVFWVLPARALEPLVLDYSSRSVSLTNFLEYLEDPEGSFGIQQVSSPDFNHTFRKHDGGLLNLGYTSSVYWLRFSIRKQTPLPDTTWLLEIGYPHLDSVILFLPTASGRFQEKVSGDLYPFSMREIPHANLLFRLPVELQQKTFYLRVETESSMQLPISVYTTCTYYEQDRANRYFLGIYYGVMLAVALYNLFLFFSLKDRNYLFYVLYIVAYTFLQFNINRAGVSPSDPGFTAWNDSISLVAAGFASFCAVLFAKGFLAVRDNLPGLNRVYHVLIIATLIVTFLPLAAGNFFTTQFSRVVVLIGVVIIFISAIKCYLQGYRPARFFLIAWSVHFSGIITYILWTFGLLPTYFLTQYGMQLGSALEAILLSLALADRMKITHDEHSEELKKVVKNRTQQIKGRDLELIQEITAHRKTRQSFRESEEKYRILVENSAISIGISKGEQIVFGNRAILDLLGYDSESELRRESLLRLVAPEERESVRQRIQRRGAGERIPQRFENRLLKKNGEVVTVEQVSSQVEIDGEQYLLSTFKDISDWKKSEEALRMAREKAEEANRLKSEFLANISHEIRTPMQAILGYADLAISRFKQTQKTKLLEYMKEISRSGRRLLLLMNDLLDLSKLESGKMDYVFEKESLSFLVDFTIREISALTTDKALTLQFKRPSFDDEVVMDRDKIMQVVHNLLSNAVKFSPEKGIIQLEVKQEDENLVFTVSDQGMGVPQDELETIFDKFTQSSKTKTGAGGTGLGLAICKEIIVAHGGGIRAENMARGGIRFSFFLPMRDADDKSAGSEVQLNSP